MGINLDYLGTEQKSSVSVNFEQPADVQTTRPPQHLLQIYANVFRDNTAVIFFGVQQQTTGSRVSQ